MLPYNKDARKIDGNVFIIVTPVLLDGEKAYIGELICSDSYKNFFSAGNYLIQSDKLDIDKTSLILVNLSRYYGNEYSEIILSNKDNFITETVINYDSNPKKVLNREIEENFFESGRGKHINNLSIDYSILLKNYTIISDDINFIEKALFKQIKTEDVIEFYDFMSGFNIHIDKNDRKYSAYDKYLTLEKLDNIKFLLKKSKEPEQILVYLDPENKPNYITIASTGIYSFEADPRDILYRIKNENDYDIDFFKDVKEPGLYVVSYKIEDASSDTDMGIEYDIYEEPTSIRPMDDRDYFIFDITEDNIKEILDEYKEEGCKIKI